MSLVEKIPLLPIKIKDRISIKDGIQRNEMQVQYYTTYFGKKITIHHPDIEQVHIRCLKTKIKLHNFIHFTFFSHR